MYLIGWNLAGAFSLCIIIFSCIFLLPLVSAFRYKTRMEDFPAGYFYIKARNSGKVIDGK
jgi:hypothetical protein